MNDKNSYVQLVGKGGDTNALAINRITEVIGSTPDFREFVKSLMVISQHAHIRVDIGKGKFDTDVYALKGIRDAIGLAVFPLLSQRGENAPLEWSKEVGDDSIFLKLGMPKFIDRYRDFPELVKALKHVEGFIANSKDVRQFFRDSLSPDQLSELRKSYVKTFSMVPPVYVKRSDVASAEEKLALQEVKSRLTSASPSLLGGLG